MSEHPAPLKTLCLLVGEEALARAAALIAAGGIVAVPTETVYGLAGDARSNEAVGAIYAAKGRPGFNPLIVHVNSMEMAHRLAQFDDTARALAARFWPGPLTLVLPLAAGNGLASAVTAGLPTVALRWPAGEVMQALIAASGRPLAAPSANASGSISPTSAAHVLRSLDGRIPLVLDGGDTRQGLESTIAAPEKNAIRLLRPGPISPALLAQASGLPVVDTQGSTIEAPGQLLSHYAPAKPLRINAGDPAPDEYRIGLGAMTCHFNLSEAGDLTEAARRLFAALHAAEESALPRICVVPVPMEGIGLAINDRLARAAA